MRATSRLLALCLLFGVARLAAQNSATVAVAVTSGTTAGGTFTATTGFGSNTGVTAAVTIAPTFTPAMPVIVPATTPTGNVRIINLSTRARVTPDNPLITGFAISGTTSRKVLVRAAGPALGVLGLSGAVAAPRLRLHNEAGEIIGENAGWETMPEAAAAIATTGAFPFAAGSADSAIVTALVPGKYSAEVIAGGGNGGVALVEIYDVNGTAEGSQLTNVSTLATVASAGGELISGFILAGTGSRSFLVRGVGPGLKQFGMTNVLADPQETLFDATGRKRAVNDDWSGSGFGAKLGVAVTAAVDATTSVMNPSEVIAASAATGAFSLDPANPDSAMVVTLSPGAYTVQVRGLDLAIATPLTTSVTTPAVGGQTVVSAATTAVASITFVPAAPGVALLEIYAVP